MTRLFRPRSGLRIQGIMPGANTNRHTNRTTWLSHADKSINGESGAQSFHVKAKEHLPAVLKPALEPIFQALERIHEAIQKEDQLIERLAKNYPDVELLSQPNGVGVLTALVYLLTLEDKNRFRSSRMVGAHLGLRPRKSQSGENDPQLRITKAGKPFDVVIANAGVMATPFGHTADGFERSSARTTWATLSWSTGLRRLSVGG